MSGVRKGTILARDPEAVSHQLTLGVDDARYITVTNYDFWDNDWREFFDNRRAGVLKALAKPTVITMDVL